MFLHFNKTTVCQFLFLHWGLDFVLLEAYILIEGLATHRPSRISLARFLRVFLGADYSELPWSLAFEGFFSGLSFFLFLVTFLRFCSCGECCSDSCFLRRTLSYFLPAEDVTSLSCSPVSSVFRDIDLLLFLWGRPLHFLFPMEDTASLLACSRCYRSGLPVLFSCF